jgi:flagellar biosynthesis chaperone FliJ
MLSSRTVQDVQQQIETLQLAIRHYSRCAIATHRRQRREWFEVQVRRYEALAVSLTMALQLGGVR